MNSSLKTLLDRCTLLKLAGRRYYERGEDYFVEDKVRALAEHEGAVTASVRGTRRYRVRLWVEENEVAHSCTCPLGAEGAFCKHCVAAGLAWLGERNAVQQRPRKSKKPGVTMDDVREYLLRQDNKALVDMLMEQALEDDRLRNRFLMRAAKEGRQGLDLSSFRDAIDNAVNIRGFVDYASAYDYARGIEEMIDSVEDLLKQGYVAEVMELTERALAKAENAMGRIDDSDGNMSGVLERLQSLHHDACKRAQPDPAALAKRLFDWELRSEWEIFFGAAATYGDVLRDKGLAAYRKLAEAEWVRVPPLMPRNKDPEEYGRRFRITSIMETLARQSGDIEALVAVKTRNLSHAFAFLEIAEIYKRAGKHDGALEWAERGVHAFPERTDSRLREFLAVEYHRRNRHDEAMALVWAEYSDSPGLQAYQKLKAHADRIGQWSAWREKALGFLRESVARAKQDKRKDPWAWSPRRDHSDLVSIFLWEKDVDAAWREAREGSCSDALWMELAVKREKQHPDDALTVYLQQIEPTIAEKQNDAYVEAVHLMRKARRLMIRLGREDEFPRFLESVRRAHKPKRNLMRLLDEAKWS